MSVGKLGIEALKGTLKIAKKAGNAIAIEQKIKRPFVQKTDSLTINSNERNTILEEIKLYAQIAKKIQELSKKSHFSYLEKLSRKFKDDCKVLFSKIKTEQNNSEFLDEIKPQYESARNKFLNKTHTISKTMYSICYCIEETFCKALLNQSANQFPADKNILNSGKTLGDFLNEINNIK